MRISNRIMPVVSVFTKSDSGEIFNTAITKKNIVPQLKSILRIP